MKKYFYLSSICLFAFACQKKNSDITIDPVQPVKRYDALETFDMKAKAGYALDTIDLVTGSWIFNQALTGNDKNDARDGSFCVRIQKGKQPAYIETLFDIQNLDSLVFSYGKFGNTSDKPTTLKVMISTDGGVTYTQIGENIVASQSVLTKDTIALSAAVTKARIRFESDGVGRLNLDNIEFKGVEPSGIQFNDIDYDNVIDTAATGQVEPPRNVTAGSDAQPSSGDNSNLLLGNPSNAVAEITMKNNYLVDQKYYVESYNTDRSTPNWVSWHLQAEDASGTVQRQNNFAAWAGLPNTWYSVTQFSYQGSGYDRGHNCPSADRTSSTNANSATFLMTNMIPQSAQNNQKTWNNLEMFIRDRVRNQNEEAYIIMGSYGELKKIDQNRISVPSMVWKVVVFLPKGDSDLSRIDANTTVLAVNTPNTNAVDEDWKKYIVTIEDIETATGYQLLSALPAAVKTGLKTKKFN